MTDSLYQQFLDSMVLDFNKWHDGIGYDLEALEQMGPEDRLSIEKLLIKNLAEAGGWRDVDALAALGTPPARAAVVEAQNHRKAEVRHAAIRTFLDDPELVPAEEVEELVIQAIGEGKFQLAEHLPTLKVKRALLECTRQSRDSVVRTNAAGLLMYLCGQAPGPFDWSQRPFFLRFGHGGPEDLRSAWEELRQRTGL